MLASILIASFVVVCLLALREIHLRRKAEIEWINEQIEEDILTGELDVYFSPVRMDVPGKYPALHTRSTKASV